MDIHIVLLEKNIVNLNGKHVQEAVQIKMDFVKVNVYMVVNI